MTDFAVTPERGSPSALFCVRAGGKLPQGRGRMSPFFKTHPPPPSPGGMGLFCQAVTGADGLHGTDMGTKNLKTKKSKWHFENQRVEGGQRSGHLPPFSMKLNCQYLCQKTAKIKAPDTRAPSPPPPRGVMGLMRPLPPLAIFLRPCLSRTPRIFRPCPGHVHFGGPPATPLPWWTPASAPALRPCPHARQTYFLDAEMQSMCQSFAAEYNRRKPPKPVEFLEAFLCEVCPSHVPRRRAPGVVRRDVARAATAL